MYIDIKEFNIYRYNEKRVKYCLGQLKYETILLALMQ